MLRQFLNESYGNGDHLSNTYNGSTIAELHEHYNVILNSLDIDQQAEFIRYFNDRVELYFDTGIDDPTSGILTGTVIDLDRVCFNVWVWCWEDPFDFDFGSGGGGSGGGGGGNEDFHPTWQEEYDQLRFCEGVNDIFDTGPDNPSQLHPNYDFCAIWMAYLEDCILPNQPEFNDFEAIGSYEELVLAWAEFQYNNPELFTTIIAAPADCTPTSELEEYTPEEEVIIDEECRSALLDFLATHGITLTKEERLALLTSGGRPECTDQEAFEEWVASLIIEDCLAPFHLLFDSFGIFDINEKLSFCYGIYPEINLDPPSCLGCSVEEAHTVISDQIKAFDMLECAIEKLQQYDGNTPSDVKTALENNIGGNSSIWVARYIQFIFKYIRNYPYDRGYEAQNPGEGHCGGVTAAWTYPLVHFAAVKLCRPNYWNQSDTDRPAILIHEWMHLYYFAGDIAYSWDSDYDELNSIQQLFNAEAFEELIKEICDE